MPSAPLQQKMIEAIEWISTRCGWQHVCPIGTVYAARLSGCWIRYIYGVPKIQGDLPL